MESHHGRETLMYFNNVGVSSIVHVFARRPVLAATVVLAVVVVAHVAMTPAPPPTPPPPAVVSVVTTTPEPEAYSGSRKDVSYTCEFGKAEAPTNLCKATLDSIALFLQNDTDATVKVSGSMNHVLAVRKYFTQGESKLGIASRRIEVDADGSDSDTVTIEQIP